MPTGNVLNRTFGDLFSSKSVRYEIPFFQRGYAWEQRQWKKLFEDINEQIIENVTESRFEDEEHFFGPIVVLEKRTNHPSLKRFLVIDGQQRITTVYLLLAVIKNMLENKAHLSTDAQKYINEINALLKNDLNEQDDYLKIKVFSTKGDRLPTFKAVFDQNPYSPYLAEDQLLYNPNDNKIDEFLKFAKRQLRDYDVPRLWNLYQSLIKSLKIVWIPLDETKDDAQAIFESLNDAGMPLSASELLCNYIFRPITNDTTNEHEKLHNDKWLASRRAVGSHIFEDYLRDLFSIGEKKRVGLARRMYVHYKTKNRNLTPERAKATLETIFNFTGIYNQIAKPIQHPHNNPNIRRLLMNIAETNMTTIYPFLMALLNALNEAKLTVDETINLLNQTYILLVRRKITSLPVTKYDTFFPSLLDKILYEPDKIKAFHAHIQLEQLWVSDQIFSEAFSQKALYNQRELNFTRHVLQELDKKMQNFGEHPDYSTIDTIEHILPQTLNDDWRKYLGQDATQYNLPTIIDTLGNLCLNSRPANSSFGQKSFTDKQNAYTELSALARDVKSRTGPWNINAIEQRSKDLAAEALKVWAWHSNN
ncbi:MAG: DUF262 domain-containing HNH endonuclease family protein [Chitinophagales bacterium]|nr:DUF262 domain-containing HNH endonuclease family protein [Chitinophagales bacterium]